MSVRALFPLQLSCFYTLQKCSQQECDRKSEKIALAFLTAPLEVGRSAKRILEHFEVAHKLGSHG